MNNNNRNNFNLNNQGPPKENIPRGEKIIQVTKESSSPFVELINISLHASSGLKLIMKVPRDITYKELFRFYVEKIGVSKSFLGKEIIFLFNAMTLDVNDEHVITNKLHDNCTITVIDRNNVIGAKIN
jgi:hypothetical protein